MREKFELKFGEQEEKGVKGVEEEKINETEGDEEEKEKREIEMIEKSPLFYQDKMDLALTYLDEKPVSWIDVSERYEQTEEKEDEILDELESKKDQVQQMLDKIGFVYEMKKFKTKERTTYNSGYDFIVSKSSENLFRFKKALEKGDEKEIGLCLGYPKTAVEGFINKNTLDYKDLPKKESKKLIKEKTSKFLEFRLSKDHWRDELKTVRKRQRLIKEKFPNLYKKVVKEGLDQIKSKRDLREKLKSFKILQRRYSKGGFQKIKNYA